MDVTRLTGTPTFAATQSLASLKSWFGAAIDRVSFRSATTAKAASLRQTHTGGNRPRFTGSVQKSAVLHCAGLPAQIDGRKSTPVRLGAVDTRPLFMLSILQVPITSSTGVVTAGRGQGACAHPKRSPVRRSRSASCVFISGLLPTAFAQGTLVIGSSLIGTATIEWNACKHRNRNLDTSRPS